MIPNNTDHFKLLNKILGEILVLTPSLLLIIDFICFITKVGITPYNFPFAIIGSLLITFILYKNRITKQSYILLSLISTTLIITFCILCCHIYDYSFDGQWYHQKIIYYLQHGWNPVYETCPSTDNVGQVWVNHYPKGIESIAASIAKTFNNIEAGKGLNLILTLSAFFYTLSFFFEYLKSKSLYNKLFYSIIITFSPVVLCQFLTYYIDWLLYVIVIITCIHLWNINMKKEISCLDSIIILCITILAISAKFTYIFWISLILLIYASICLYFKEYKLIIQGIKIVILGYFIGFIFISFNPYISNIINGFHIFYPLMGNNKIEIMSNNAPEIILESNNRLSAALISLFTRPNYGLSENIPTFLINGELYPTISLWFSIILSICIGGVKKIRKVIQSHKLFFSILFFAILIGILYIIGNNASLYGYYRNFQNSSIVDCRLGGFGAFFIEAMILSIISTIFIYKYNKRDFYILFSLLSVLFISLIILPSGWWARYVPFFYLFTCIPLIYLDKNNIYWNFKFTLALLISINLFYTSYFVIKTSYQYTEKENHYLELLKNKEPIGIHIHHNQGFYFKLIEKNIKFYPSDTASYKLDLFPPVHINHLQ